MSWVEPSVRPHSDKISVGFCSQKTQVLPFILTWIVYLSWSGMNCSGVWWTKMLTCIGIWADAPTLRQKPAVIAPLPDLAWNHPNLQCCYSGRTSGSLPCFTVLYVSQHVSIRGEHSFPSVWLSQMRVLDCCRCQCLISQKGTSNTV